MIKGFKEARQSFKNLAEAVKPKVVRSAVNAALTEGVKAARDNAPIGGEPHKTYKGRVVAPGFLRRAIQKSTRVSQDKTMVMGKIKVKDEAWYGSLIEFGFKAEPPRPWFFPAIDRVEDRMEKRYFEKMDERVQKEFNK